MAQRAELGAAFGTKKAIRAINTQARNKLDHESYGVAKGTQGLILEAIAAGAASLPTAVKIETDAHLSRPIPPPNFEARTADEVYDMDDVVSAAELEAIDIEALIMARTPKDRSALLPHRHSKFINTRVRGLLPTVEGVAEEDFKPIQLRSKDKKRLRYLVHLSYLMAFRMAAQGGRASGLERNHLIERLACPPVVVDALLERYTELQRTGSSVADEAKFTGAMEIKLLGYLMVVALKIDKFGTDVKVIAEDLKLPAKRYVCPRCVFLGLRRTR